jgi:protein gp37
MSDLFHEGVPLAFVKAVWSVMAKTPWHTYQILTKRSERMSALTATLPMLGNVWLGTSVENLDYVDRIDELRKVNAAVRFVSFEPLLGPVGEPNLEGVDWVIVGGESGPRARPMLEAWVDDIEAACRRSGTAFFFKQWGGVRKDVTGRTYRGQTFDEMPSGVHGVM